MCYYCSMKGLRADQDSTGETIAHIGAAGSFARLTAASAGEFTSMGKLTTALPVDGVGDLKPPVLPALLITTDNVPDAPDTAGNTNPVITVTGPGVTTPIISTIDTIGDQDYYKVTLTAGVTYEFGMYSYNGGPNAVGLTDPYLELYAANGTTLIVSADGGANTVYNQANSGFDVLLTYTPTVSGTYYVNARAFSNSAATPNGDSVGDYELFVRQQDPNDPDIYTPYYKPTEVLYAIDWGTQVNKVNQSARNPDGNEGTRTNAAPGVDPTGNAQGTPVYTNLVDIPALAAAQGKDITGKNVITIYFAKPGDVFVSNDPTNPGLPPATITAVAIQDFEYTAVWTALAEFEKVADVIYLEVDNRDHADFIYTSYQGTPGPGISLLGSMSPPDESDEGLAQFNSGDSRWNARDLAQGGFSFVTLIHEFGHGHGLAHPHDNGGRSGIMNGVEPEGAGVADYTTGQYQLNQGVFTMMSYEDGWQSSTYGNAPTNAGYGYLGGLMAFDIAAIQDKYGVNEDHNSGNDTYVMKDVNAAGTYFYSIWDAGGIDEIVYNGNRHTSIDLRSATLRYEPGGGGYISYAYGIHGGFTIANGVVIENATTGGGNDYLRGNNANNRLDAGSGNDIFMSFAGNDTLIGRSGDDLLYFGSHYTPADFANGGTGQDSLVLQGNYTVTLAAPSVTGIESVSLQSGSVTRWGDGNNNFYDYNITTDNNLLTAGQQIIINGQFLRAGEDLNFNGSAELDGKFLVFGGSSADTIQGGAGADLLSGGGGQDNLTGGAGADIFRYDATTDSQPGTADLVADFLTGVDKFDLTRIDANTATGGDQAFTWIGSNTFSGSAGQLRLVLENGFYRIEGDTNGDSLADFVVLFGGGTAAPVQSDFML